MSRCDLLALQGKCKRDPEGYRDDVLMQLQHYDALRGLFMLKPGKDFKAFADLVGFLAQVAASYPRDIPNLHVGLLELLDKHHALLDPHLRRALVAALILLHNRGAVPLTDLLPLFFRLFRVKDKQLRITVFRHVVAAVKAANKKRRDERLNRDVQTFLQTALTDENETAAKKALAVITELYRKRVWGDARTVNLVAEACAHPSAKILVAACKFFLGQDEAAEAQAAEGDDEEDSDEEADKPKTGVGTKAGTSSGVSKEDVYKAYNKGVSRTKKKKQEKLKRQMASIRRANKREDGTNDPSARFAAMQLIDDPQAFAEGLFRRLQGQGGPLRFEAKMLLIQVVSRVVGLHRLHLLHLYPFLQRYVQPNQLEVTRLLASAATACHELVPPDALEPLLRQLVNQFVHDRARPEVVAVGINAVREICLRCPLVMTPELLQDLAQYKRARDKPVATAARALIALFRELAPGMLEKKDRGKGADLDKSVAAFGAFEASTRVAGAEMLQRDIARRRREARREAEEEGPSSGGDGGGAFEVRSEDGSEDASEDGPLSDDDDDSDGEEGDSEEGGGEGEGEEDGEEGDEENSGGGGSDSDSDSDASSESGGSGSGSGSDASRDPATGRRKRVRVERDTSLEARRAAASRLVAEAEASGAPLPKVRRNGVLSLSALRRMHREAARRQREAAEAAAEANDDSGSDSEADRGMIETERVLDPEDFKRIKALKTANQLAAAMARGGAKKASATAEAEMRAMLRRADRAGLGDAADRRVDPDSLAAVGVRKAHDKASRVASIMAGREDRGQFGAASERKNKKTGGTSNAEKAKRKNLPLAARVKAAKNRRNSFVSKRVKDKQFKGRFRR